MTYRPPARHRRTAPGAVALVLTAMAGMILFGAGVGGFPHPASGARLAAVGFPPTYPVNFSESGLPVGANWSVSLNASTLAGTGTSAVFSEPNGTYQYTVHAPDGWPVNRPSGTVTVAGAAVSVALVFQSDPGRTSAPAPAVSDWLWVLGAVLVAAILLGGLFAIRRRRPAAYPPTPPLRLPASGGATSAGPAPGSETPTPSPPAPPH